MTDAQTATTIPSEGGQAVPKPAFLRPFAALTALGLVGVASLTPLIIQQLSALPLDEVPLPPWVLAVIALLQSAVLVAVAVAIGLATAPALGLRSLVVERMRGGDPVLARLTPQVPLAVVLGLGTGAVILGLDAVLLPLTGLAEELTEAGMDPVTRLVLGLFYGGITEELLMRWALVGLFAWLPWRFLGARDAEGRPSAVVMWIAIGLVAIIFGLGHLPALAGMVELTPLLVVRTVLLNAIGGVVWGWLFWRRSLEAAMVSHASAHVAFAVAALATALLG